MTPTVFIMFMHFYVSCFSLISVPLTPAPGYCLPQELFILYRDQSLSGLPVCTCSALTIVILVVNTIFFIYRLVLLSSS